MAKSAKRTAGIAALAILIASCGDISVFSPSTEPPASVEVASIPQGALVSQGETVLFLVRSPGDAVPPSRLVLSLERVGSEESVWEEVVLEAPAVNEDLEIEIPTLATGQYRLHFSLYSDSDLISKTDFDFFFVEGSYDLRGVTSYPPVVLPDSTAVIRADIGAPDGSDPYVRWRQNDTEIAAGLLSDGLDELLWPAPEKPGVYGIRVELFPVGPVDESGIYPFASAVSLDADLYVSAHRIPYGRELGPEQSYYSLYHLNGNLNDFGYGAAGVVSSDTDQDAIALGEPEVAMIEHGFGYRLDESAAIRIPRSIVPSEEGEHGPFTLRMAVLFETAEPNAVLLRITDEHETDLLKLHLGDTGNPEASVALADGSTLALPSGSEALVPGRRYVLSLSVVPDDDQVTLQWFVDGSQTSAYVLPAALLAPHSTVTTKIGGEPGFAGVVDELGVYSRTADGESSTDPNIFDLAMRLEYGDEVLLAEGFDGVKLPDKFVAAGPTSLVAGSVVLESEASMVFPSLRIDEGEIEISMSIPNVDARSAIAIGLADGSAPFLSFDGTGALRTPETDGEEPLLLSVEDGVVRLSVLRETDGNELVFRVDSRDGVAELPFSLPEDGPADIALAISSSDESEAPTIVDWVLVRRVPTQREE